MPGPLKYEGHLKLQEQSHIFNAYFFIDVFTSNNFGQKYLAGGGLKDLCLVSGRLSKPLITPSPPQRPAWNSSG